MADVHLSDDERLLAELGYKQELNRSWSSFSNFAISFSIISVGTPEKVVNDIGEWTVRMKTNHINSVMHVADMPHWKTVKNLTLFAQEVMPRLKERAGSPQRMAAE